MITGLRTIPGRASERVKALHRHAAVGDQSTSQMIGALVTAGKTLYVTNIVISAFNVNTASRAVFNVLDGDGGTLQLPMLLSAASAIGGGTSAAPPTVFGMETEPLPFTIGFWVQIVVGTLTYSALWIGYEV